MNSSFVSRCWPNDLTRPILSGLGDLTEMSLALVETSHGVNVIDRIAVGVCTMTLALQVPLGSWHVSLSCSHVAVSSRSRVWDLHTPEFFIRLVTIM